MPSLREVDSAGKVPEHVRYLYELSRKASLERRQSIKFAMLDAQVSLRSSADLSASSNYHRARHCHRTYPVRPVAQLP
jgi:hypothetical protein